MASLIPTGAETKLVACSENANIHLMPAEL